jgi:FimV-like protein
MLYLLIALLIVITLLFLHLRKLNKRGVAAVRLSNPPVVITSQDIKAIAGDDIMSTQLDLARAYIELNKFGLAKKILEHVLENGNTAQQQAATQLLASL